MSNLFTLNWGDFGKGIVTAFVASLVTSLMQIIDGGVFPTNDQLIVCLKVAGIAGVAYLLKNLLTNDEGKFLKANVNS